MHSHTHIHTHTHTHTHINIHTHARTQYIHGHTHTYILIHTHVYSRFTHTHTVALSVRRPTERCGCALSTCVKGVRPSAGDTDGAEAAGVRCLPPPVAGAPIQPSSNPSGDRKEGGGSFPSSPCDLPRKGHLTRPAPNKPAAGAPSASPLEPRRRSPAFHRQSVPTPGCPLHHQDAPGLRRKGLNLRAQFIKMGVLLGVRSQS